MTNKLTIAFSRREAELYRSHGLLEEARQLYCQVLDEAGSLGPSLTESLQEKILKLEDELAELDVNLSDVVSGRELCILREGWGDAQEPSDIITCADALGTIGLYDAAIEEYRKLIRLQHPLSDYIRDMTECLMVVYSPESIQEAIEDIISHDQPEETHPNFLRIAFALELVRMGVDRPALALYETAHTIRPLPARFETHVRALRERLKTDTPHQRERETAPCAENPTYQLKVRLANRLARLRGLIRRLRKA